MSVLDANLRDFDTAYAVWVGQAAEVDAAILDWYRVSHGHDPAPSDLHHAMWRYLVERDRWGTLRNALQETWPISGGGPPPVEPPIEPDRPQPPIGDLRLIRVASAADGPWHQRWMSYWANGFIQGDVAYVFAGHADGRPRFWHVRLSTGEVQRAGGITNYAGTTEGWHWTPDGRIVLLDGSRLRRVSPFNAADDQIVLDISQTHTGCDLWQPHSSDDGQTYSATVRFIVSDGPYPYIGTVVQHRGEQRFFEVQKSPLDESQVTRNASHLVIKEGPKHEEDNRIITLGTWASRWIRDAEGALGHSDCGDGFMVGEDDTSDTWQMTLWDLDSQVKRVLLRGGAEWGSGMGYVSCRGGRILHSGPTHLGLVGLNGSYTQLLAHGGGPEYDDRVKAALTPCGRAACYMSGRDIYLLVL